MWISAYELKTLLGADMAAVLCRHRGGTRLYIPHEPFAGHEIAKLVGVSGMAALCKAYGGEQIALPNPNGVRKDKILRLLAEGHSGRAVAQACGVTERYVHHLAGLTPAEEPADRQLTLF